MAAFPGTSPAPLPTATQRSAYYRTNVGERVCVEFRRFARGIDVEPDRFHPCGTEGGIKRRHKIFPWNVAAAVDESLLAHAELFKHPVEIGEIFR